MKHRLDEIECNRLRVVNSYGKVVASVESDAHGNGKVEVFDKKGKVRVEVSGTGDVIVFDERGEPRIKVAQVRRGERAVTVTDSGTEFEQSVPTNASVESTGSFGKFRPRRENSSPNKNTDSSISSKLRSIKILGYRGSVTYTRPIAVTYGGRRCTAPNNSWRNLIEEVSKSLGVRNPCHDSQLNAEAIRRRILDLIARHEGADSDNIVFEVEKIRD